MADIKEKNVKSFCYGCGQPISNYTLLICPECLGEECDTFQSLTKEEDDSMEEDEVSVEESEDKDE